MLLTSGNTDRFMAKIKPKNKLAAFLYLIRDIGLVRATARSTMVVVRYICQFVYNQHTRYLAHFSNYKINDPLNIVYLSPVQIDNSIFIKEDKLGKHKFRRNKIGLRYAGDIRAGDWDKKGEKFNKALTYTIFNQRFNGGKEWAETDYYAQFQKLGGLRKCSSWETFLSQHLQKWDTLYQDIKTNGYKNHQECRKPPTDEIEVAVDRDGEILFIDGRHRLVIAKLLKIPEVPVIVNIWHRDFIDYVKKQTGENNITPAIAIRYAKP